jgi:hypothetical protein
MVAHFNVGDIGHWGKNITQIEIELTYESEWGGATSTVTAALAGTGLIADSSGSDLGLMIGHDETGNPMIQTFREYNQQHYWRLVESLPVLKKRPTQFVLLDTIVSLDRRPTFCCMMLCSDPSVCVPHGRRGVS